MLKEFFWVWQCADMKVHIGITNWTSHCSSSHNNRMEYRPWWSDIRKGRLRKQSWKRCVLEAELGKCYIHTYNQHPYISMLLTPQKMITTKSAVVNYICLHASLSHVFRHNQKQNTGKFNSTSRSSIITWRRRRKRLSFFSHRQWNHNIFCRNGNAAYILQAKLGFKSVSEASI